MIARRAFVVVYLLVAASCLYPLFGWIVLGMDFPTSRILAGVGVGAFMYYVLSFWLIMMERE